MKSLPEIELDISGVGGTMKAVWKRFRVKVTSDETGEFHFEEIYLAEEVQDPLMSYETLQ